MKRDRYLAGGDDDRLRDLHDAFVSPNIQAVFAARGGFGSTRLLEDIDYHLIRNNPKPLIGFSDTTALQLAIAAKTGLVSVSGVTIGSDVDDTHMHPDTEISLWSLLYGRPIAPVANLEILRPGSTEGVLLGGCLSLMCSLLGTPFFPDTSGAILVIEDVNEEPYRVDRMLTQLRSAGVLRKLGGLACGRFVGCVAENPDHGDLNKVLADFVDDVPGPVVADLPYGHFSGRVCLPIGARCFLDARSDRGTLTAQYSL